MKRQDREIRKIIREQDRAFRKNYPALAGITVAKAKPSLRRSPDADPSFVRLGYNGEGKPIPLDTATRLQHLQAIGMTRSGKSKFLLLTHQRQSHLRHTNHGLSSAI